MEFCDAIDFVRTDDAQVGHSNTLRGWLFDERKHIELMPVARILLANFIEPEEVDEINKFEMSR